MPWMMLSLSPSLHLCYYYCCYFRSYSYHHCYRHWNHCQPRRRKLLDKVLFFVAVADGDEIPPFVDSQWRECSSAILGNIRISCEKDHIAWHDLSFRHDIVGVEEDGCCCCYSLQCAASILMDLCRAVLKLFVLYCNTVILWWDKRMDGTIFLSVQKCNASMWPTRIKRTHLAWMFALAIQRNESEKHTKQSPSKLMKSIFTLAQ